MVVAAQRFVASRWPQKFGLSIREGVMKQKYYFLCNDGQKWFDDEPLSQCPRCGYVLFSAVKIKPPWLK
jgi:hypothetical protein